jgi:polyisoprenoid-binding protein YceI
MKYSLLLLLGLSFAAPAAHAQTPAAPAAATTAAQAATRYSTGTGLITFFSSAPLEDIEALNSKVGGIFELATGKLAFSMLMSDFQFKNSLMQEHFNENYMESDKFPKATFNGRFSGVDAPLLGVAGSHAIQVEGDLTIHGVTHHLVVPGTLELKNNQLLAFAFFTVAPADYNIEVPRLVRENIAKVVSVRVSMSCDPVGPPAPVTRSNGNK